MPAAAFDKRGSLVVGIATSAGGSEALPQVVSALGDAPGCSIVVVHDLAPPAAAALVEALREASPLPVRVVADAAAVRRNRILVVEAGRGAALSGNRIITSPSTPSDPSPIDRFLGSLAEARGSDAIGVLLAGRGGDGNAGLTAIEAVGGLTLAVPSETAAPADVAAAVVDHVRGLLEAGQPGSALARAKAELENLLCSIEIPTLFLGEDLELLMYTPAATELYDVGPADVGRAVTDLPHKAVDMPALPSAQDVHLGAAGEAIVQLRDGRFFARRVRPYTTPEGEARGVVVTFTDVTELRERDLQIQSLLDAAAEGIYGLDLEGRCTFANPSCARMLGYARPEDLIGREMHALIHHTRADGTSHPLDECPIYRSSKTGARAHIEDDVLWRRDGSSFHAEYWSNPVLRGGSINGCVVTFLDISARRQAQIALRETDERLRLALESAYVIAFEWDIEADAVRRPFSGAGSLPAGETMQTLDDVVERVHPRDRAAFRARVQAALDSEDGEYTSEYRIVEPDGAIRWLSERGRVEFGPGRRPLRLTGLSQDITERKLVDGLRRRLAAIVESSDDAIIGKTLDGIVTSWNLGAEALYGYTEDEMIGEPIARIVPPERRAELEEIMARLRRGEAVEPFETWRVAKDGTRRDVSLSLSVVEAADGTRLGASAIARDISDRLRHERALHQNRERLRLALAAAELGTFDYELDGGRVRWDGRARAIFGVDNDATLEGLVERLHPDDRARWDEGVAVATEERDGEDRLSGEYRIVRRDGTTRWVQLKIGIEFEERRGRHTAVRLVGAVADITDQKTAEIALREGDRRKDEFLAMLGHELRNPLAAIRSATELIELSTDDARPLARAKEVLKRQVGQMTRLVDGLLEISRITRGKIDLRREQHDLRVLASQVVEDRGHRAGTDAVTLQLDVPDDPVWIDADEARVVQILDNLVGNALKFTAEGSVSVRVRRDGEDALVDVVDTGIGIDPSALPWLFEPFRQPTPRIEAGGESGLGLGLALVKGLVELHGGSVDAHSDGPGRGARFSVRLPLGSPPTRVREQPDAPRLAPLRVLIVEDNPDAGEILRELLLMRGHDVDIAEDGHAALECLRARPVDVVLCDLGLPGMDGYEVARTIRGDDDLREIGLIALSGFGQPGDRSRTEEAGFDAHLTKPVELAALEAAIARVGSPA